VPNPSCTITKRPPPFSPLSGTALVWGCRDEPCPVRGSRAGKMSHGFDVMGDGRGMRLTYPMLCRERT
jgi:hypothetical protein